MPDITESGIAGPDTTADAVASSPLLAVRDLRVAFRTRAGVVNAVNGLSFSVAPGEVLGIVGESGSGKSVSMYSMMGLLDNPNATITGSARFDGAELIGMPTKRLNRIRGNRISMIFQDPMTALTPVYTVGWQIVEQIMNHEKVTKAEAWSRAVHLLDEVGIPDAERRARSYPHEFSGGMRQRVMIAMSLACHPSLLIADEPTTALDVTTQRQILELIGDLQAKYGSSVILITHDMGVISEAADRVIVMYAGRAVEMGDESTVVRRPRHPYTWGLLGAIPKPGQRKQRLPTIPGLPPGPRDQPTGCPFQKRCRFAMEQCSTLPPLIATGEEQNHLDACWLPDEVREELREEVA
ncbi:ABC transporter ATP-binding protein [Humibacter ginsenosidimutans]|uniref:ABC transporter ATP-binding protein n=1 Tax=Humibacter ginsenosidimutans TaxID=2599293 RepID=UPI001FEFF646|nr:ABC transporter ATP-binding protein [Humibacter ginsenosidimutans]